MNYLDRTLYAMQDFTGNGAPQSNPVGRWRSCGLPPVLSQDPESYRMSLAL